MEKIIIEATKLRPEADRTINAQLVTIDLPSFIKQLKSEKSWKKSDRNSITVFKSTGICMVLIALHKGAEMIKHTTEGLVSVQILKGKLKFTTNDQSVKLRKGHILTLHSGVPHSIQANKTTIFLLTITAASGDNYEKHISDAMVEQNRVNGKTVISETA
jgi:quercetin dioxygenase-like cupin family protein